MYFTSKRERWVRAMRNYIIPSYFSEKVVDLMTLWRRTFVRSGKRREKWNEPVKLLRSLAQYSSIICYIIMLCYYVTREKSWLDDCRQRSALRNPCIMHAKKIGALPSFFFRSCSLFFLSRPKKEELRHAREKKGPIKIFFSVRTSGPGTCLVWVTSGG